MEELQPAQPQNQILQTPQPTQTIAPQSVTTNKTSLLVILLIIILSIATSYFGYQNYQLNQKLSNIAYSSPSPTISQTTSPTSKSLTTPITNSPLFEIKALNLTFQLPSKLTQLGSWETITMPGDTGDNICFHLVSDTSWLIRPVKAGGVGICSGKYLTINSVSSDFTAGRGGSFTDISGYRRQGSEYFLGLHNSEGERPLTTNNPHEMTTSTGINYLLITGEDVDNPGQLLPSEYVGALINTGDSKYPGIVIAMQLSDKLKLDDFKQILNTFKFTE